jgi:DNA-binding transcriptional MerR regulator
VSENGLLKMSQLAERSGVSSGTIKHYLREGLLPEPVRTSRNMAYYPPEFVDRIRLIKQLQEDRFMPLKAIKHYLREGLLPEPVRTSRNMAYYPPEFVDRIRLIKQLQEDRFMPLKAIKHVLDGDPARARALVELEDRILERAAAGDEARVSGAELVRRYEVPKEVLERLAELGVLTPTGRGYSPSDVRIVEAISRFRAGGYDERMGFTVYDTLRYKRALEALVEEEVQVLLERLAGEMDTDRAVALIDDGAEPLRDLIAALHQKLLVAELKRQRASRD